MASAASRFGRHLTVGVEEELLLVDPETHALVPGVERLLGPEGLKAEVFSCLVEAATPVCGDARQAAAELRRLRELVRDRAEAEGLAVAAAGMHPFSSGAGQPIVAEPRYLKLAEELGPAIARQLVCGLHVHIGMESFAVCLERLEAILPWLPSVLALSLNSPYEEGAETGLLSARSARMLELPRCGAPPALRSEADWEAAIAETGEDYSRTWWDARPHPRLGTLEIRIADQQTSAARAAGLVALVQALCVAAEPAAEQLDREAYRAARVEAAATGRARDVDLLALVEPAARRLGTWELVEELHGPAEAHRQLAIGRADGLRAVAADLVERSS